MENCLIINYTMKIVLKTKRHLIMLIYNHKNIGAALLDD